METKKCLLCKVKPQMRFEMGINLKDIFLNAPVAIYLVYVLNAMIQIMTLEVSKPMYIVW